MKVTLVEYTKNAAHLLVFSKRTRHMAGIRSYDEVKEFSEEQLQQELDYVFTTISSSWEFVDYVFLLEDVTRAFTHQFVRHRVGTSFAQQTQRGADVRDFNYLTPTTCEKVSAYHEAIESSRDGYVEMLDAGVPVQDARGVLPTNIYTNILFKANLRTLNNLMNLRLCVRAQGEFQEAARRMRKEILSVHPWAAKVLVPFCVQWGVCQFPRFKDCPLKKVCKLDPDEAIMKDLNDYWEEINYESQPDLRGW